MSNKRSSRPQKSSAMQKRGEGNLGQKEARLENEKASELTRMGEKTRESEESERALPLDNFCIEAFIALRLCAIQDPLAILDR